jgi:GNAT superfamily N-acetyltransferase
MNLTVRRAGSEDLERIDELLRQVCNVHHRGRPDIFKQDGRKYNRPELEIILEDDSRPVFVGVDECGQVQGYCFCVIIEHEEGGALHSRRELYIDDLCVDERARGGGIGRKIFSYIKEYARSIGCYHLTLNVWACNESAMQFYESMGMHMLKKEMEVIL